MNIIVGATGQVGSMLISELSKKGAPVIAAVRDPGKVSLSGTRIRQVDLFNAQEVVQAFSGGTTAFLLTPENPTADDIIADTEKIVENYRKAVEANGIKRIVGLSCIGAQLDSRTGNILMSKILEAGFATLDIEKIFIRPAYFYSNWLAYSSIVEQYNVLPTFFPENLHVEMNSPLDLARFIADIMSQPMGMPARKVYELAGPAPYSSTDVASTFATILGKEVLPQSIPPSQWKQTLLSAGFTENTAENLMDMTKAVIDGLAIPEFPDQIIKLPTTLDCYLTEQLKG
jgi:Predicted nucleoside-diphosphate-sugar epimerases